jgi:hypothetical protein
MDRKKHNLDKAKNPELNYQKVNQFLIYLRDYQIQISETYNDFMKLGLKIELKDNGFELINWHDYLLKNSQIINNKSNKNFSKNNLFKLGSKYNQLNQNCINIQKIIKLLSLEIDLDSSDLFINKVIQNSFSSKSKEYYENEYQNGKILGVQINNQQYISTLNKSEIKQNLPVNNLNTNHSSINTNFKELGISWKDLITLPKTIIDCYSNPFFKSITKSNEAHRSLDENIDNEVKFNNTFLNKITFKNQKDKIAVTAILKS